MENGKKARARHFFQILLSVSWDNDCEIEEIYNVA